MLPVLHNFNAIKGELISLNIGYNNVVASENLFACVRKYRTDANNHYAQKGWAAQTFAYKGDLGSFIRKTEIGQYALTPGDAASRYVNNIQARSFAKYSDLNNYVPKEQYNKDIEALKKRIADLEHL